MNSKGLASKGFYPDDAEKQFWQLSTVLDDTQSGFTRLLLWPAKISNYHYGHWFIHCSVLRWSWCWGARFKKSGQQGTTALFYGSKFAQTDLVTTYSSPCHIPPSPKSKVDERKQDALRGVESPLIFMALSQHPRQVRSVSISDEANPPTPPLPSTMKTRSLTDQDGSFCSIPYT